MRWCRVVPTSMIAALVVAFSAVSPGARPAQAQDLSATVDSIFAQLDRPDAPGAAVAIVKDGVVVLERGYGSAQLEYGVAITPATVFHVASVSKQFTAFAIVLLAHDGKLSLDNDIRTHLPELPDFGRRITIRQLIHHTSGIRDQWELLMMAGWRLDDVITRDQIMALMRRQRELNFEPGAEYLYSNMGYSLLAEIVERVSGVTFGEFLHERVFEPLGMTATHVHSDHQMPVPNRAYSYRPAASGWSTAVLSYANQGATSLFTTVGDLAKWIGNLETGQVGGAGAIAQMRERGVLNSGDTIAYAFALIRADLQGREIWQHGGADAGFRSQIAWYPEDRLGIIVLSNAATGNPGPLTERLAHAWLGLELPDATQAPVTPPARRNPTAAPSLTAAQLDSYTGDYYSPELGTVYTIELRAGALVASHVRLGVMAMTAVAADTFRLGNRTARFERAADGSLTGFRLTGSRVRNLLFVRLPAGSIPPLSGGGARSRQLPFPHDLHPARLPAGQLGQQSLDAIDPARAGQAGSNRTRRLPGG